MVFIAIVKVLRKSLDLPPFAVRCIIVPMYETAYMSVFPVIRILS